MLRPVTAIQPEPLTHETASALLAALPAEIGPGLSEAELEAIECRYGFTFADDHRVLLQAGLPLGRSWPDWRDGDPQELRNRLDAPADGVLFDVEHAGFWYPAWGERPEDRTAALRLAREHLLNVPQLVPVFGHRYLPAGSGQSGHPVLSVMQTDIIYYGNHLADYLHHEFGGPAAALTRTRASVPFWSYFLGETGMPREVVITTPHDPYAVSADEAVDHLRMLAIEQRLGRMVGSDQLIQAALVALVLDVDTPALRVLAGLTRNEEPLANGLFVQVIDELGLAPAIPDTQPAARWTLVRWWLRLIANGSLNPVEGGDLIWYEGWDKLGHPDALRPIIGWTSEYDDWTPNYTLPRDTYKDRIIQEAHALLNGPWPPDS
ncbi:hypothetical protein ABIA33_004037 [Streptacidiphilus sp. MAP12-16]